MSDEGEKICQICAEEMDLTDQQLKPCKCGYEICVWCWHQIMDMADKDESAGRCPACRTPYNKEKIVGTTASCGRLASDMNVEKRPKSSRGKNKSSEGRKQLANMRVIQRNLVYVVGLPLNMADEDLLHHREYFGQYGKVLKVSISRPTSGVIQPSVNSTCSVYITYSKEEEAVRCIQSVHGFFLDGKPLRACFGTTKYCHAWLRNAPCSNPDCLYLHEIGSQEDSFTKDEIVSAYTRVQQITGSTNSTQRRSGYMLPPPSDEYCNETSASSGKPINITAVNSNNTQISAKVSPTNSSSGRSALPAGASWGTRAANGLPLHSSKQCSNGVLKKSDASDGLVACSTAAASQMHQSSLHSDSAKILVNETDNMVSQDKSEAEALRPELKESNAIEKATLSQSSNKSVHPTTLLVNKQPLGQCTTKLPAVSINGVNSSLVSGGLVSGGDATDVTKEKMEKLAHSHCLPTSIQETETLDDDYIQVIGRTVTSQTSETTANTTEELDSRDAQSDFRLGMPRSRTPSPVTEFDLYDAEDDLLSFENQRLKDPEVAPNRNDSSHASHLSSHSDVNSTEQSKADSSIGSHLDRQAVDKICSFPIGRLENVLKAPGPDVNNAEYSNLSPTKRSLVGGYDGELKTDAFNLGESSIISDILSIDFDPWDESLTSPQDVAKLLGENNKQQGSFGVPGSWKHHGTNQSRFSFAREDENRNQASGFGQSVDCFTYGSNSQSFGNDNNFRLDKLDSHYGFPLFNGMESDIFPGSHSLMSSNRLPVSRPHVSAPPGFSVPSKTPPPGFTSHDRANQMFDVSGNHLLNANSVLRHNYQTPAFGNTISNEDIELIDPAILAVGKGLLPGGVNSSVLDDLNANYFSQFNAYEEAKFQSILQRSLPSHQSHRFASPGESFSPLGNTYSMPSTVMEQTLANNMSRLSQFTLPQSRNGMISNGQRDGWNELQAGNNLVMTEILRNERSGFNKFYDGYEDSKIRMPNSGNLFNGTYGI